MKQADDEATKANLIQVEKLSYGKAHKAFLISLYYPKADTAAEKINEAYVIVQASHEANTYKFKDLASAFAHLESLFDESLKVQMQVDGS